MGAEDRRRHPARLDARAPALARLGDPGGAAVLWHRDEMSPPRTPVWFRVAVKSRRALLWLCWDAASRFGDPYGRRKVEVEGDLANGHGRGHSVPDSAPGRFLRPAAPLVYPLLWERYARAEDAARVRQDYHLGNDFYRLWLDRDTMQYTCAYYPEPGLCLEEAQRAKAHYVCRKSDCARVKPSWRPAAAGADWPSSWPGITA